MNRVGIYVNGKEITQRFLGKMLVWQKVAWKLIYSIKDQQKWGTYYSEPLTIFYGIFIKSHENFNYIPISPDDEVKILLNGKEYTDLRLRTDKKDYNTVFYYLIYITAPDQSSFDKLKNEPKTLVEIYRKE